jgi:pentatricopeptide repeat protein
MPERDVVSWTSMISAFAQCGMWNYSLRLLEEMQEDKINPNSHDHKPAFCLCARASC